MPDQKTERDAIIAAPTERPNGLLYRPRKPIRAEACSWNEDGTAVLVYGTHDDALARPLAEREWRREGLDGDLPEPVAHWIKQVPWDALGLGYARTVLQVPGTTKGSTPVLRYGVEYDWPERRTLPASVGGE
ncbi:hypothetical protein [Nocardioides sp.]|uniref:hypothetical protein n=1 Tax=Nocardioides sp. TaxID=35761 RepID=UPI0035639F14